MGSAQETTTVPASSATGSTRPAATATTTTSHSAAAAGTVDGANTGRQTGRHRLTPLTGVYAAVRPHGQRWRLRRHVCSSDQDVTRHVGCFAVVEEGLAYAEHLLDELARLDATQRRRWLALLAEHDGVDPIALLDQVHVTSFTTM